MKEIIIVGAGGCGREVLQWIKDINKKEKMWTIKGFIDDDLSALDGYKCDYTILGKIVDWTTNENEVFAMAIANPYGKEKVVGILKEKNAQFVSIVHPRALISDFTHIGTGSVIYPGARLSPNSSLGDFVTLLDTGVGHDAVIDDYASVSAGCALMRSVYIGKKAFVGANAVLLPNIKVGCNAYVGAGSVVIKNIKDNVKVFGNPAKRYDIS